jgi:hypothetical protein
MGTEKDSRTGSADVCASCGLAMAADAAFCGSCGRPVGTPAHTIPALPIAPEPPLAPPLSAGELTPPVVSSALWPAAAQPQFPPPSGWSPTLPATGIAALASTPVAPPAPRRPWRGVVATLAALCIIGALGGAAYWVFAAIVQSTNQTETARYLPDTTLFYTSVDLAAAAANSHHIGVSEWLNTSGAAKALKQATNLDWQTDVMPWVGRSVALGAFPNLLGTTAVPGVAPGGITTPAGFVLLIQSHDDGAAKAAVAKALARQEQNGAKFAQSSYGGFTLYTASQSAPSSGCVATGSSLVVIASSVAAAQTVIDRANGKGTTLAGTSEFQRAIADLPAGRFGTVFVSVRAFVDPLGTGGNTLKIPFLGTYPSAAGSLAWTADGLRTQVVFKPARSGVPHAALAGDTTSLAGMVPDDAQAYVATANGGALANELTQLVAAGSAANTDPVQSALGVPATDPVLAQPAAFYAAAAASAGAKPSGAFLLHAPDASAAQALLAKIAKHDGWTSSATTVSGTAATNYYAATTSTDLPAQGATTSQLVAVAAMVGDTLVVADSASTLGAVIATAHGSRGSLAHASQFQRMAADAPAGRAAVAYVDVARLQSLLPISTTATAAAGGLNAHATAAVYSLVWTPTQLQLTVDLGLSS